jgi:hypothetical protein
MTEGTETPVPKVILPPALIFFLSKTQAMVCVSFKTFTAIRHSSAFSPAPIGKTKVLPNLYWFGPESTHATATAIHFPANAALIF